MMNLFKRSATGLFASTSLLGHLVRGGIAALLVIWAIQHQARHALSLAAAAGAVIAFRGCPLCWTIGLVETFAQRLRRRRNRRDATADRSDRSSNSA
jgi:hypothetical protein